MNISVIENFFVSLRLFLSPPSKHKKDGGADC